MAAFVSYFDLGSLFALVGMRRRMTLCSHWISYVCFFFSSRRRHTRLVSDWSSDVCSSDLMGRGRRKTRTGDETRSTFDKTPEIDIALLQLQQHYLKNGRGKPSMRDLLIDGIDRKSVV